MHVVASAKVEQRLRGVVAVWFAGVGGAFTYKMHACANLIIVMTYT